MWRDIVANEQPESLSGPSERRMMRRGLLAGIAGVGAAAFLKVTGGTRKAEAANNALVYPAGNSDPPTNNQATNRTELTAAGSFNASPMFRVSAATSNGSGIYDAIQGVGKGPSSSGVVGQGGTGHSTTSFGVQGFGGLNTASAGDGSPGVRGVGGNSAAGRAGPGVRGDGAQGPAGDGIGVLGFSPGYKGVYGQSTSSDGVHGTSVGGVGLRGTSPNFVGVVGISDNSIGVYGLTSAPNVAAIYAEHLGTSGRLAGRFYGDVHVEGNFVVTSGAKNAAVPMPDGSEALMYCQEAPEPYFEDFGRARLVNGHAHVQLDAEFASLIKRDDYMVFLTPGGELKSPLYVNQQGPASFEVQESNSGRSDIPFTYRIVGKRKDIEGKRLARLDPRAKQNIAAMKSQAAAKQQRGVTGLAALPGETPLVAREPLPQIPPAAAAGPDLR